MAPLLAASCGIFTYHPVVPYVARDPEVAAGIGQIKVSKQIVKEMDEAHGVQLEVVVATQPGAGLGTPSLNAADRPPCSGGIPARSDGVLGVPGQEGAILSLAFSRPAVERAQLFSDRPATLDLPVLPANRGQPGRCLRIPLQKDPTGIEWRAPGALFGLELRGFFFAHPLPNYQSGGLLLTVPVGAWIGPWRFAAAPGGGFVGERNATPAAGQGRPTVGFLGAAFEADRLLVARGHIGIDLQLAYDVFRTVGPRVEADAAEVAAYRAAVLHGPRVAVRWIVLPALPRWPGFSAPPDLYSFGLAAFAGGWWQSADGFAPIFGLSLEGNIGY